VEIGDAYGLGYLTASTGKCTGTRDETTHKLAYQYKILKIEGSLARDEPMVVFKGSW
jgi:hypothetical protein